ncbi:hypothetical protein [Halopiger xanaduensis]|uniref:Uncharacterized protein n=1 Tax=Halopiger xanaduensis (strain DSM 18323 / JCM 14033 / SH-6) TaxID=797210 RepID=F8D4R4_HALXS|nr:hypothetical protein [Halopiger xanaduensis]AEH37533.1 hypothetical protein Halxa_2917 [Halopiger xanaduensis SH-6]
MVQRSKRVEGTVLNENDALVLDLFVSRGGEGIDLNRSNISSATGLTNGQVQHSTNKLANTGYLRDCGEDEAAGGGGSPPKQFRMTSSGYTLHARGDLQSLLSVVRGSGEQRAQIEETVWTLQSRVDRVEEMARRDVDTDAIREEVNDLAADVEYFYEWLDVAERYMKATRHLFEHELEADVDFEAAMEAASEGND